MALGSAIALTAQTVYLCGGQYAYAYHSSQSCSGLNNCGSQVFYVDRYNAVQDYNRRPCCICWSNVRDNCTKDGSSQGESSSGAWLPGSLNFVPYRSVAPSANYYSSLGAAVGRSIRNAVPTNAIVTEVGTAYKFKKRDKDFSWYQLGKCIKWIFSKRRWEKQSYSAQRRVLQLTSNSMLVYLILDDSQTDCYCKKIGEFEWRCGYGYASHIISARSPNDFQFRLKDGNLYYFWDIGLRRARRQDVYTDFTITE